MAEQRKKRTPWESERWWDSSFTVVSISPEGEVRYKFPWNAAEKREHLERLREAARGVNPNDYDPNGGMLGILEEHVSKAEAKERHAQSSKSPDLARVPLME